MRSLYRVLGLAPGADEDQIKSAFRQLAKQAHPDVNAGESASGERFKEIHQAYRLLHDPQMRAILDGVIAEAHAATRRRWLMAMATMTAVFILTVGGGLLFAVRLPSPHPQMSTHQAPARAEGKTPASAERRREANGKDAKSTLKLAAALAEAAGVEKRVAAKRAPAAAALPSTPADAVTPSAPVGAQADADPLAKAPAPVKGLSPSGATNWGPALLDAARTPEEPAKWSTYRNERFGFSLNYPSRVFAVAKGGGDDEVLLVSHDGRARLRVSGTPFNRATTTLPAYRRRLIAKQYGDAVFDRTPLRKTWFALSGRRGDKIFYARVVCACDARSLHTWELTYPPSERSFYEPIVQEIRRSYRREGEDERGHCQRRGQA